MAFLRHYSSDALSRSLHSAADTLGIEDFRAEPGGVLNFELGTDVRPQISTTTL